MALPDLRNSEAAKGHESPHFDDLRPQWQKFVLAWLRTFDYERAALDAGYNPKYAYDQGFSLSRRPDIVKAIEEIAGRRLTSTEQSRGLIVHRLLMESTVSKADLVMDVQDPDSKQFVQRIRPYETVEECFRCCLGMVEYSREGDVRFNLTAQNNSRKQLASYMKWDREAADMAPPLSFHFGLLKPGVDGEVPPTPAAYEPPTDEDD